MPQIAQEQSLIDLIFPGSVGKFVEEATPAERARVFNLIGNNFISNKIKSVWAVNNNFLEAMYLLKKEELERLYDCRVEEKLLLHVTNEDVVDSIILDNFDWRRVSRGLCGKGTSFSPDVVYCHRYAGFAIGHDRAIIVTKVLVTKFKPYVPHELIPPLGFDTTVGHRGKVFVKFSDSEYLPIFVAFYNVSDVDPATIMDVNERKMHIKVLNGVKEKQPKGLVKRRQQKQPKRLIAPNAPTPISQQPRKPQHLGNPKLEAAKRDALRDSFKLSRPVDRSCSSEIRPSSSSYVPQPPYSPGNAHRGRPITTQDYYSSNVRSQVITEREVEYQEPKGCCSKFMDDCCKMFACLCFCFT